MSARDGQRPVDVAHAEDGPSVHAEQHAGLAQEPLGHPEVLEVVDGEPRPLVEDEVADVVAEARGRVQDPPPHGHHGAVFLVDRLLLLPAAFLGEQGQERAVAARPPVQRAVLGHGEDGVVPAGDELLDRLLDGERLPEGGGGLEDDDDVHAVARLLQLPHRVDDDRLEARDVGREVAGAQERGLGAVHAGDLGHARVVGGDDDAVEGGRALGRLQRVGEQRPVAQPLDVEVGNAVRPSAGGDDADDTKPVLHQMGVILSREAARAVTGSEGARLAALPADPGPGDAGRGCGRLQPPLHVGVVTRVIAEAVAHECVDEHVTGPAFDPHPFVRQVGHEDLVCPGWRG
jgi:hypothetical protein